MSKTLHTHRGHCQMCGRIHAVDNITTLAAKHGYTVSWGTFHGVCRGADYKALEQDRTKTDEWGVQLTAEAEACRKIAAQYEARERIPELCFTGRQIRDPKAPAGRNTRWIPEQIPWADAAEHHRADSIKRIVWDLNYQADAMDAHVKMMRSLAHNVYGKPLLPAEDMRPVKIVKGLRFKYADDSEYEVQGTSRPGKYNWWKCQLVHGEGAPEVAESAAMIRKLTKAAKVAAS